MGRLLVWLNAKSMVTSLEQYTTSRDNRVPSSAHGSLALSSFKAAHRAASKQTRTQSLADPLQCYKTELAQVLTVYDLTCITPPPLLSLE